MIVDLNQNYRIRTRPGNYVLERVVRDEDGEIIVGKSGKQKIKNLGFFGNMKQALSEALKFDMEDKYTRVSMQKYLEIYQNEVDSLNQLLPKVGEKNDSEN